MQDRSQPCLPYQGALACELPCVWGGGLLLQMLMPKHSNSSRHTGVPICLLRKALSLSAWATWRAFRTFVLDLSRFKLPLIHHMTTASSLLLKTAKARENMDSTWLTAPLHHLCRLFSVHFISPASRLPVCSWGSFFAVVVALLWSLVRADRSPEGTQLKFQAEEW